MTIKYIRNTILISAFGAVLCGCDTTEDAYHLGGLSDVRFSTVPASQLRLTADGKAKDIEVASNVYWDVQNLGNRFTVKASTDKGDGTVSVEGPVNINAEQTPSETVLISARDFDKEIRIEVIQAKLSFAMADSEYPEIPEEGGKVPLKFNSSIDWQFKAQSGDTGWLEFNPGYSGEGGWNEIEVSAVWTPNYTTSPRNIELQLRPVDPSLEEFITLPSIFTLTQAAGTLPLNLAVGIVGVPTRTESRVRVSYESKAPVEEVGVTLSANGVEVTKKAAVPEGGFPMTGSVEFVLTDLTAGTLYEVSPYVVSKVGKRTGEMTASFTTEAPEYVYQGAKIVDVQVKPDYRMVAAEITVESDCRLVEGGFSIYNPSDPDNPVKKYTRTLTEENRTSDLMFVQSFSQESEELLEQNTEYQIEPFVVYHHPKEMKDMEAKGNRIPFKTLYRTPVEDDNNPIK